jgi:iron complex outermembrane recepter protein
LSLSAGAKDITVYAFGGTQETNGYRANNHFRAKDGQVRVDWKAAPLLGLGIESGWHEDEYGMPSGLSVAQMDALGRRGTRRPGDYADTRDRFIRLTSDWTPVDASGDFGTLSTEYAHRDRDIYAMIYDPSSFEATKTSTLTDSAGMKYRISGDLAEKKASLITGVDLLSDRSHTIDESSYSYQDVVISREQKGFYAQGEYEVLEHLTADFGGRHEKAQYIFTDRVARTKTSTHPTQTVWGGGLKYDYAQNSNVFIRADETYRFLNTDEGYSRWTGLNTTLKQQSGIDYRMGVKHAFGDLAELRFTPFMTRNKDEIFLDPTVSPGNNANYGRTQRVGLDAGSTFYLAPMMSASWLKTMDINVEYRFLDAKFQGGRFDGQEVPMAPVHQLAVGFNAILKSGLSWNVTSRFLGAQYGINDDANTKPKMKPSMVTDTRLGYQIKDRWETFVGVNNLFNERYDDYLAYGAGASTAVDHYPAMDRNYVAGVKCKF